MTEPVLVEVVAYAPTAFYHCAHCEVIWDQVGFSQGVRSEQLNAGLPEDLRADYQAVSDWAHKLMAQYGERVAVRVIDAASVEGFAKAFRHRVRRFPAIIVAGRERFPGGDFASAQQAIDKHLPSPAGP
jgi:hypothetical protein